MSYRIRAYEPHDAVAVRECITELQAYERALEPDRVEATAAFARRYLKHILSACREQSGELLVAEVEGMVAGFVCYWIEQIEDPITTLTECAYVSDLAVRETYRRRGIGRALLRAAEERALRQDAATIRIGVLAANDPAHDLYTGAGYRPFELLLTKPLIPYPRGPSRH